MKLPRRQFLKIAAGAAALPTLTASDVALGQPQAPRAKRSRVQNAREAVAALEKKARAWLSRNRGRVGRSGGELAKALSSTDAKALNAALYRADDLAFELSMECAIKILDCSVDGSKSLGSSIVSFHQASNPSCHARKVARYSPPVRDRTP